MEPTEDAPPQIFWGLELNPGEPMTVKRLDDFYVVITNVSFGELPENYEKVPHIINAKINTIELDKLDKSTRDAPEETTEITIAILIPETKEQTVINQTFNPLNSKIVLKNNGKYPVYVSGFYYPIDEDEYDEEEEEEEIAEKEQSDEKVEAAVTKNLLDFVQKHKNKPANQ